jgi:oxygen-independent coproporphyrinogen-3 oxidase
VIVQRPADKAGSSSSAAVAPLPPVGLYVHIPFCISLCPYCDFVVYAGASARGPRSRVAAFLRAVHAEIDLRADALDDRFGPLGAGRPPLETLYLGGGTPSLLPPEAVAALVDHVGQRFGLVDGAEVTLEANPGPDERGDAAALRQAGITRLSIGAQRLNDGELRGLGRRHVAEDVGATVAAAREAGIASVSLDLLYDVPGDSAFAWARTLDAALALRPDHVSLYALTLDDPDAEGLTGTGGDHLPTSSGARRWRDAARRKQDEDRAAEAYALATDRLAAEGFRGYEISNWARPGHESRHNLAYWERRSVEAVGPGAHAFDGIERRWNAARLDTYLAALAPTDGASARLPPGGAESLNDAAARAERLVLGLRTDRGVPAASAGEPPLAGVREWAEREGLLEATDDERLVLTLRGRLLSNELFARLV